MSRRLTLATTRRTEARRVLLKSSNTLAVRATSHMDAVPPDDPDYWHDLRRGRRWVWGGLLRFIDRCATIGTPLSVVLDALDALRWYAMDCYDTPPHPPAALKRAA